MQYIKTLVRLAIILTPVFSFAQTTYLPQDAKENVLLERLEIKLQRDSVLNFSKTKPYSRKAIVPYLSQTIDPSTLSRVDQHNYQSLLLDNIEWTTGDRSAFNSRKPIGRFFRTPANFYEVHIKDFDLVVNPIIQFSLGQEKDYSEGLFQNTRGLTLRGKIADKIGFAAYLTENQERDPLYVQDWENRFKSVPGAGYYKDFKTDAYDYFDARGYFTFGVTKYIDVAFGYDRNFIGNGQRSLFLSDFANNSLFLKLNTRIWKFNYQNLFMELVTAEPRGPDRLLGKKYAVMHHLDFDVSRSINIGLFEGVIFGRKDHFEFGYLNPVIFYRSIEQQNGSFDNSVAGLDFKANAAKHFQFYGQLLLDEFKLSEIKAGNGWWGNKWGYQLGAKYIDALGIKNLDLQLEVNRVRPFTYSHNDSVANYTHYNQPLAHPLGANFSEVIAVARYQPAPKWMITGKLSGYKQGLDVGGRNFGSNIFLPNVPPYRLGDYGYEIGSGQLARVFLGSLLVSYELKENMFIDLYGFTRNFKVPDNSALDDKTTVISAGFRWNMHRREFAF
jgi:hypothetical protein